MNGLTIGGTDFSSFVSTSEGETQTPNWIDIAAKIGQMVGRYEIIDFMSGYKNLSQFFLRVPKWPIGGFYFDGILRTEHVSTIRPTDYPVQTGETFTDHAVIEPASLSIEVMMTDTSNQTGLNFNPILTAVSTAMNAMGSYSNILQLGKPSMMPMIGDGRSAAAWSTLKAMQLSRVPITVETRLQTYENMLIEELSAPDDYKTLNALKATVRLREIIVADVAEIKTSARASATAGESASGTVPNETGDGVNKTAAEAGIDKIAGGFGGGV